MEGNSKLGLNPSIFLTTNNNNDNIYCECRGRMLNFLNNYQIHAVYKSCIVYQPGKLQTLS
jgi:hypothetical protein